jgi:hypothetical protein
MVVTTSDTKLLCVRGSMINNSGFCIGWLGLLALQLQLFVNKSLATAHNLWLPKTRSIPNWTTSVFRSFVTDPVLIYESVTSSVSVVRWLTFHSWTLNHDWNLTDFSSTNDLRINYVSYFHTSCEPNTEHYLQQFTLFRIYPLLCKRVLIV